MPKVLILVADGSEEIEFVTPYDVLTRAGFEVKSVGVALKNENHAHMSRNIRILPDYPDLRSVPLKTAHEDYDILILPGGAPGAKTFCSSDAVLELIGNFRKSGKWVAAICAATTALVAAELIATEKTVDGGKKRVTSHPSVREEVEKARWEYSEERVVVDGKIITSRGPGTAMLFALTIVEELCGKEKRNEVEGPMICAETL
ncbi:class I glutamine amidotransferase-like protein [Alternaria rosae]|uniref:class I glutamine amidotransferase-like protein n=1 Tax=Alternaria rosae TaxID=1187941 RepID=UPI001E8CD372|nr:class I glutamine amidotransferase-like protein [Alternaria rosae]KAH6870011.1 class I glutamine amidotransferase-like protein [Alternaria rosae]